MVVMTEIQAIAKEDRPEMTFMKSNLNLLTIVHKF